MSRRRFVRGVARASIALVALAIGLLGAEFGFRVVYPDDGEAAALIPRLQQKLAAGALGDIRPCAYCVYRRRPGGPVNRLGFFDRAHPPIGTTGATRVVVLGGSTSESYGAELERVLRELPVGPVEVFNLALSGYTSAESLATFALHGRHLAPDVVVIHHGVNDAGPRSARGFRTDYSHWRRTFDPEVRGVRRWLATHSQLYVYWLWKRGLREYSIGVTEHDRGVEYTAEGRLRGETNVAFASNVRHLCALSRSVGARPFVMTMPYRGDDDNPFTQAIRDHNGIVRTLADEGAAELIDLFGFLQGHDDCFMDLVHVRWGLRRKKALFVGSALWAAGALSPARRGRR